MTPPQPPEPGRRGRYAPDFLQQLFNNPLDPGYADAAVRRAASGPRPAWARRTAYALKIVTLVIVGMLLATAYREAVAAEPDRSRAHAGLVDEVKTAQQRTDDLQERADELRRQVTAAQLAALTPEEQARIREQEAAAGLGAVAGDGAVVELADAPVPIDPTTGKPSGEEVSRALDVDLQTVVNGLWAAGAEAIAINGQRLTSVSTIRAAGNAILVDFRPVTSPYQISAIGPDEMLARFSDSPPAAAMRDLAATYGIGFSARDQDGLTLPAAPSRTLRYAEPLDSPTPGGTR